MQTNVINVEEKNNVKLLTIETSGLSNVEQMYILTQSEDIEKFNSSEYFDDSGILTGCDYVSVQYSYGSTELIKNVLDKLINEVSNLDDLCESEDLMETFFIVFDAGNNKSLLVSNYVELFSYLDIDSSVFTLSGEMNMVCGSIADDNDISTIMMYALSYIPKTKGFKVPNSDFFELDSLSADEFVEYQGSWFSDIKSLKTNVEWLDFFKSINKLVRNSELNMDDSLLVDDVEFILKQYDSCQKLTDDVQLVYKGENSHKFYNVMLDNNFVEITYGGVGKSSTSFDTSFDTIEQAREFLKKKVISKIKSGYELQ